MVKRPCLDCGTPTPDARCPACTSRHDAQRWQAKAGRYNGPWREYSKRAIEEHRAKYGNVCPGWQREPHPTDRFVTDHDVGPVCPGCNATKAATFDKHRARADRQG